MLQTPDQLTAAISMDLIDSNTCSKCEYKHVSLDNLLDCAEKRHVRPCRGVERLRPCGEGKGGVLRAEDWISYKKE